jgi:hypothetical protein
VANVSVLGQVRGSNGFTTAANHLVEGAAVGELRIEFLAKLARPAGTRCVETIDDGWVNMFHGKGSSMAKTASPVAGLSQQSSLNFDQLGLG